MRKYGISLIVLLIILSSCNKDKNNFSFKANLDNIKSKYVVAIKEYSDESFECDTLPVSNNSFEFSELKDSLMCVRLYINGNSCVLNLYADTPGSLKITGDTKHPEKIQIVGTKTNNHLNEFRNENSVLLENIRINQLILNSLTNEVKQKKITHMLDSLHTIVTGLVKSFVIKYPDSGASAILIRDYALNYDNVQLTDSLLKKLTPEAKIPSVIAEIEVFRKIAYKAAVGSTAPGINLKNNKGIYENLSTLKGNYIVLNFTSTTDSASVRLNNQLESLYKEYKDSTLKVMNIYLDVNRKDWQVKMKKSESKWLNVFLPEGFNSGTADVYGLFKIPQTFLVDRDSKIIARNFSYSELKQKLSLLFPAKK